MDASKRHLPVLCPTNRSGLLDFADLGEPTAAANASVGPAPAQHRAAELLITTLTQRPLEISKVLENMSWKICHVTKDRPVQSALHG